MADTIQRGPGARPARQAGPRGRTPLSTRIATFLRRLSHWISTFIRRHKLAPYLLLAPALIGIALVILWPLVQMVMFAFQNYGQIGRAHV